MAEAERHAEGRAVIGRVLVCNPLYLISAVLVLLGLYYVTHDQRLLDDDTTQLLFNFSSLQLYELCLVITAVVLARRFILRDALLLVVIENVFLFVPFILFTGAAYLGRDLITSLAGAALGLLVFRLGILQRRFDGLRLSARLLVLGLPALLLNLSLPLVYHFHQIPRERTAGCCCIDGSATWRYPCCSSLSTSWPGWTSGPPPCRNSPGCPSSPSPPGPGFPSSTSSGSPMSTTCRGHPSIICPRSGYWPGRCTIGCGT